MELSRKDCRLCLSQSDFNVSLYGNYCRRTNMIDKILVCLKLVIEDRDLFDTICFKCADNVERYYEFIINIKKCQTRYPKEVHKPRQRSMEPSPSEPNKRQFTSYVREQVCDPDYSFSFLELANNEEKKESKVSSPFFSYFSPPNVLLKQSCEVELAWKKPKLRDHSPKKEFPRQGRCRKPYECDNLPRHHSRDLFESQSQDEGEPRSLDWKLTPDDNIIKRIKEKCFGRSDF